MKLPNLNLGSLDPLQWRRAQTPSLSSSFFFFFVRPLSGVSHCEPLRNLDCRATERPGNGAANLYPPHLSFFTTDMPSTNASYQLQRQTARAGNFTYVSSSHSPKYNRLGYITVQRTNEIRDSLYRCHLLQRKTMYIQAIIPGAGSYTGLVFRSKYGTISAQN